LYRHRPIHSFLITIFDKATFPNPWKQAFRNRTRPKGGVNAVSKAAGDACRKLGVDTLSLFQVENPWYYIGGTKALARGMLETLQEGHAQNVGCVDMSITKLYKLQRLLAEDQESLATNQFEFSLTNRQNLDMIEACRKLGITPICRNVFDGGLATGKFTPTTPTGGSVSMGEGNAKGPYSLRKLEKLDALFQTMESVSQKVGERIKSDLMEIDKEVRVSVFLLHWHVMCTFCTNYNNFLCVLLAERQHENYNITDSNKLCEV
jgi:aryl-alcohol dehydrogenase-like predicted oxidoreductase